MLLDLAFGWTGTGASWSWQQHPIEDPFLVVESSFVDVDPGELHPALDAAMASWNGAGADAALTRGGTAELQLSANGTFVIEQADVAVGGGTLAFAGTWTFDDGGAFDCDVVFLTDNDYGVITWSADPAGPAGGTYDLQSTATHELGHCLGLDHSADGSAIMYAYYSGSRALAADDVAGVLGLHGPACVDGDGDGWTDCDLDCDETNALVHPGAGETCNGLDDDCDGVVDQLAETTATIGGRTARRDFDWGAGGNAVTVTSPTALVRVRAKLEAPVGTRLAWAVHRSDDGATWQLVRSWRAEAMEGDWQESPELRVAMVPGPVYAATVGVIGDAGAQMTYDATPSFEPVGELVPVGGVFGRALSDDLQAPSATNLFTQEWVVVAPADPDGDGSTADCGDCAPDDAAVGPLVAEACNGIDDDCDALVDEEQPDTDADGVLDCFDPCPADPADTCDDPPPVVDSGTPDTGPPDHDTAAGEKPEPAGCGCATGPAADPWALLLALGLWRRRR